MASRPTDPRRYRRQTEARLLWGVLLLLVVGGSGLIGLIFGWEAALSSWLCLLPGAAMILGLWLFLSAVERLIR